MHASTKRALVIGATGQDGAYLCKWLLDHGYDVFGSSRDAAVADRSRLRTLGIAESITLLSLFPSDFRSVLQVLKYVAPGEIYMLGGQSSVGLSFEQPVETIDSLVYGTLNLLEAVRFINLPAKVYHASSSEMFGDTGGLAADEDTPFRPRSPYAVAKTCAHNLVTNYREAYGMYACSGILFNHESPLRPDRFVTRKVVKAASRIASGYNEVLELGNLDIHRDWGWAPEYVEAMWMMLQQPMPRDFVVCTGHTLSLREFIRLAFSYFGLNWLDHVNTDEKLLRPSDIPYGAGNPERAKRVLGWQAITTPELTIQRLCEAERRTA